MEALLYTVVCTKTSGKLTVISCSCQLASLTEPASPGPDIIVPHQEVVFFLIARRKFGIILRFLGEVILCYEIVCFALRFLPRVY